jgi:hypothetical protein
MFDSFHVFIFPTLLVAHALKSNFWFGQFKCKEPIELTGLFHYDIVRNVSTCNEISRPPSGFIGRQR